MTDGPLVGVLPPVPAVLGPGPGVAGEEPDQDAKINLKILIQHFPGLWKTSSKLAVWWISEGCLLKSKIASDVLIERRILIDTRSKTMFH